MVEAAKSYSGEAQSVHLTTSRTELGVLEDPFSCTFQPGYGVSSEFVKDLSHDWTMIFSLYPGFLIKHWNSSTRTVPPISDQPALGTVTRLFAISKISMFVVCLNRNGCQRLVQRWKR